MKTTLRYEFGFILLVIMSVIIFLPLRAALADDGGTEWELFASGSTYPANVLIILDTSQSMDEDFSGNALGPYNTGSKLVEGKRALQAIVNTYVNSANLGIMTFKLPAVSKYALFNSAYFASYQPQSYCPNPPADCITYCSTGNTGSRSNCSAACIAQNPSFNVDYFDYLIQNTAIGSTERTKYCGLVYPKTNAVINPVDTGNYIYYNQALPYYDSGYNDTGNEFDYAVSYSAGESSGVGNGVPGCNYARWGIKTGTSDGNSGYSSSLGGNTDFGPTDSDVAAGYLNFGVRLFSYWVGQTWFANSSPGGGNLDVPIASNNAYNAQYNALMAKLNMQENNMAAYMSCSSGNACSYIVDAGLTPTAGTLQSAYYYFAGTNSYTSPIQSSCQKNFIVFVTDGAPSVSASGTENTTANLMPEVLTKIQNLQALVKKISGTNYTFSIPVYVLGVGITATDQANLNSMAATGNTTQAYFASNAAQLSTQLSTIFANITNATYAFATSSVPSARTTDENFLYEAAFTPSPATDPFWKGYLQKWQLTTSGTLSAQIWEAGSVLQGKSAASRKIQTALGGVLTDFTTTSKGDSGNITYANLNVANYGTNTIPGTAYKVVQFIRGDPAYNPEQDSNGNVWKLGDIFHSNPITVGTPNPYFYDIVQTTLNGNPATTAFEDFQKAHIRTSANGQRMIVAGANDGQFHVFNATNGSEIWSFIPPNLLPKLQYLYHASNPSTNQHQFYIDGPVTMADVWLPSSWSDGRTKSVADWKTISILSVGRDNTVYDNTDQSAVPQSTKYWSASPNCDTGITEYYNVGTAPYYCGYYALDFTNAPTALPSLLTVGSNIWTLNPNGQMIGQYLGEPWSQVTVGRVRINGNETWVGFIGGGYDGVSCTSSRPVANQRGKAVVVFDLKTGNVLWSYHWNAANNPNVGNNAMGYAIAAPVAVVDTDNDGFVDRAFVGDIGGNMWQFKFCMKADGNNCNTSNWQGSLLLARRSDGNNYPIYTEASISKDNQNNLWVFWGTGDKVYPANLSNPGAYVYGVMPCSDSSGNPIACSISNLISSPTSYCISENTNTQGWYMQLTAPKQVLASPFTLSGYLFFTVFTPQAGSNSCTLTGKSKIYGISINTGAAQYCSVGAGAFSGGATNVTIGTGIASQPIISIGPGGMNIHVSTSGAGGQNGSTVEITGPGTGTGIDNVLSHPPHSSLIYWKDNKLQ